MHPKNRATPVTPLLTRTWPLLMGISIFLVSGTSQVATPKIDLLHFQDKLHHFLVFGLFATSVIRIPSIKSRGWIGMLFTICLISAYGASDEIHQSFTPNRSVELDDWIADTLGAALATWLYVKWEFYQKFLETPVRCTKRA